MTQNDNIIATIKGNLQNLFSLADSENDNELEEYCDMIYCLINNPQRYMEIYS